MATKSPQTIEDRITGTVDRLAVRIVGLLETSRRVFDVATADVGRAVEPDGPWRPVTNRPTRMAWRRSYEGIEEGVVLDLDARTGRWQCFHQTPAGTLEEIADGLPRERAFTAAERYMADLACIPPRQRTGRAAIDVPDATFYAGVERRGIDIPVEAE